MTLNVEPILFQFRGLSQPTKHLNGFAGGKDGRDRHAVKETGIFTCVAVKKARWALYTDETPSKKWRARLWRICPWNEVQKALHVQVAISIIAPASILQPLDQSPPSLDKTLDSWPSQNAALSLKMRRIGLWNESHPHPRLTFFAFGTTVKFVLTSIYVLYEKVTQPEPRPEIFRMSLVWA